MFKNDRMMLILTGLVLAIFAGSMVKYSDRIVALMSGGDVVAIQDDSYSVRAGASQVLDVLSNDTVKGPIVVLSRPSCGAVELTGSNRLTFSSDASCTGEVEFAYCVDAEGECTPNAVRINVISVAYAQAETTQTPATTTPTTTTAQATPAIPAPSGTATPANTTPAPIAQAQAPAPQPATNAPAIASFTVEMAPPALAAPSMSEMISPSMAVASIRRASGLNTASSTDQNIATQNSASIGQTASAGPAAFAAPAIGGASNISLGGSERVVAAAPQRPTTLRSVSDGDSNIVQLERGPEALVTLQIARAALPVTDMPPLSASPELNGAAPIFVASAQTNGPTPESTFSAEPTDGGPIALIALNRTPTRGDNGAGESLNLILSEPGVQSFQARADTPSVLAPTSAQPSAVSVMARGPNVEDQLSAPLLRPFSTLLGASIARATDPAIARSPLSAPSARAADAAIISASANIAASQPNQITVPAALSRTDTVDPMALGHQFTNRPARTHPFASLAPLSGSATPPSINIQPAEKPQVLQASLPATPEAPIITAPVQNSVCEIALSATARSGANIALDINAGCKPNQMVTIEHAGIAFSVLTNAQGAASVMLPAMEAQAEINVRFEDQSSSTTTVAVRNLDTVTRAGVSWQGSMDLNLTAVEFGAAIGSEGHVTASTPRDYRTSRVKGGGYLLQLGDPSLERGALAEVYTIPTSRNQQRGTIAMSIVIADVAPVCGQTISAKTVRTRDNRSAGVRNVRFTVPSCSTILSGPVALPGAIDDIRLAGR